MGLILHLSDLHLSPPADSQVLGDHKVDVIPLEQRLLRTDLIRSTLRQLGRALSREARQIDAIVVSGDVTYQGQRAGFQLFTEVINELGSSLPPPDRVLVVPGNHDVQWYTAPSSPERYADFVELRTYGYKTSLLEGVDIDIAGHRTNSTTAPIVRARDDSFVVVGLNSANHCGVDRTADTAVQAAVDSLSANASADDNLRLLLEDWRIRGRFDIARVDASQRRYASEALEEVTSSAAVRIAVMHHQLLPVSTDEEIKPFEALTNLEEVREFLAANEIDVLLHGHKHVDHVYEDRYRPQLRTLDRRVRRLLVISAGTVGLGQTAQNTFARLIEVDVSRPAARRIRFASIPGHRSGVPMNLADLRWSSSLVGNEHPQGTGLIGGVSVEAVHEQLLDMVDNIEALPTPLVCRVQYGETAREIPRSYPTVLNNADRDSEWFRTMVRLWQRETPVRGMAFNHGARIRRYRGDQNQLEEAIGALIQRPETSRGLLILVDPVHDRASEQSGQYPAFCLAQLITIGGELHVNAYFRKQEVVYWWPINLAELAELQQAAIHGLAARGHNYSAGSITTFTALPVAAKRKPQVAVPRVDQLADEAPGILTRMALAVTTNEMPNRTSYVYRWQEVVFDWLPDEVPAADGDPAPTFGLDALANAVADVADAYEVRDRLELVVDLLKRMHSLNIEYVGTGRSRPIGGKTHGQWSTEVRALAFRLLAEVDRLLDSTEDRGEDA